MHDEQCLAQPSDLRDQVLLRGIDQELPLDPERPSLEQHLGLALRFDLRNALAEEPGDVPGVARRLVRCIQASGELLTLGAQERDAFDLHLRYSGWMPAALTSRANLSRSARVNAAKSSGVLATASAPSAASRSADSGRRTMRA